MLRLIERPGRAAVLRVPPSLRAVVSWNTRAPSGEIALTAFRSDGSVSAPLPFVRWSPQARRSLGGADATARIAVDELQSDVALSGIGVSSTVPLDAIAVSVPPRRGARAATAGAGAHLTCAAELDVPEASQYVPAYPGERGWCSAACLVMLLRYHGVDASVTGVAAGVYDAAYGTGNWSFNAAYAGARGLRAVVAHLDGLDHVASFVAAGLPVAISIAWNAGELRGSPLEHNAGHLVVVRGVGPSFVTVNDPAQPSIATRYPRADLDMVFRRHGGVAYAIAPSARDADLVRLANARDAA